MDMWQGKHFSITDPKDVRTVIYQVNKTEKEFLVQTSLLGLYQGIKRHSD